MTTPTNKPEPRTPLVFDESMHEGPEEQKLRLIGLREGYYWVRLRDYLGGRWVVMRFQLFHSESDFEGLQLVNKWIMEDQISKKCLRGTDIRFATGLFQTHNLEQIGPYLGANYTTGYDCPMEDQREPGQQAERPDQHDYTQRSHDHENIPQDCRNRPLLGD